MAGFKESNITLDFPTAKWFRFEKSEPYAQLSGFDFKEMDACWYEDTEGDRDVFYAIELKDYRTVTIVDDNTVAVRKYNLVKKTVDTMQMLLAAKYQTPFGEILEREKRVDLHSRPIEYYFVVIICEKNGKLFASAESQRDVYKSLKTLYANMGEFAFFTYDGRTS